MYRRTFILLIPALIIAACHPIRDSENSVTLLSIKGPSAMGLVFMEDSTDRIIPKKLNIEILDEPMLVRARILRDKPELAVLPLNMAAILYNKGLPYQVIAIPVWGTLYLMGTDPGIDNWQSLKNKRIFVMGKGTTPDIIFRYLLNLHNLNPDKDVILDYSFPTHIDLANATIAGQASLAVISEPMVSLARRRNPRIRQLMDLNKEWTMNTPGNPDMPQTALIGRKDFINDHPDWIRKICDAWCRSIDRVNLHPEQAAGLIVSHKILPDTAIAISAIPGCNLRFRYASELRPEISQYLEVFFNFNPDATGGKLPDEKFIFKKPDH